MEKARETIAANYDGANFLHTVACAVRARSGKIYTGVNVYSLHGACAEQVAVGSAITCGERKFVALVAVRGERGDEVVPPCGNCRQFLCDLAPGCEIILRVPEGIRKVPVENLLPFPYVVQV